LAQTVRQRAVLGFVELSCGRYARAVEWLEPARRELMAGGFDEPSVFAFLPDEIEALVSLGRLDEAERLLAPYEEAASRTGRRSAVATASRCRGLLLSARSQHLAASSALEQAIAIEGSLGRPFELGRTLLWLGIVSRRNKQKGAADMALRRAEEIFDGLGSALWSERSRRERARVGVRPRAPATLTPTEARVAELAAAGYRNADIAGELFLSLRAVEANLTRVYAKLSIRSRTELAALFAGMGQPQKLD
jgi:DNA-binding CsgD family transcriptional regulator